MKLRQTNEQYGDGSIFEASSIDDAVETETAFEGWADDAERRHADYVRDNAHAYRISGCKPAVFDRAACIEEMRREYRTGLEEVQS